MHFVKTATWALVLLAFTISSMKCAKILSVFPFKGPSQYICVEPYLRSLASRGHEVTSVTMFPQKKPVKNFRDIILKSEQVEHDENVIEAIEEMAGSTLDVLRSLKEFILTGTLAVLKNDEFQELLRTKEHFDLIIIEAFFQDAVYALGHHFKAPMIGLSTFGADVAIDQLVDNISPVAYVPAPSGVPLNRMNFWQRLENLYINSLELMYHHLVLIPEQQQLYEKYFPNATLDLSDVRRDFSLLLLNQHYSFRWARPLVPNAIEVAGMHINHKPNKLPADMEAFINASPKGTIYFSLGSNVKSVFLPKAKLDAIMNAFARLPVNVLWKFEDTNLPGKPKNVYISKWFPQSDVLAHPNVNLFITHGGMHSVIEAVHHGKPIVGMSIFYDQHLNVADAKMRGLGVAVNFREFTSEELYNATMEVLNNPKYFDKAQEISASFHDRPMSPLDTAIYWTEYVLRHKGAPQMRVAARHLNFLQRCSIDTMAVLFGIPLLVASLIIIGVLKVLKAILSNKNRLKLWKSKKE